MEKYREATMTGKTAKETKPWIKDKTWKKINKRKEKTENGERKSRDRASKRRVSCERQESKTDNILE